MSSRGAGPCVLLIYHPAARGPSVLPTCHPGARGPRKNECFCGVLVDPGIQVNRCPVRQHRQQQFVSLRDALTNLGPAVKPRGDKKRGGRRDDDKDGRGRDRMC